MNKNSHSSCPGQRVMQIKQNVNNSGSFVEQESEISTWPIQIQLVPVNAPYFENANILIAADCTAFAYAGIQKFMRNNVTLIGCPKLDNVDYSEKLTEILKNNEIQKITVLRMEVPCCSGIVNAVKEAFKNSGKIIEWRTITISIEGEIIEN